VLLQLTAEQQQQLAQVLRRRLQVLQQCQVYSLPPYLHAAA
jgi:type VI protein secretion system component VasK